MVHRIPLSVHAHGVTDDPDFKTVKGQGGQRRIAGITVTVNPVRFLRIINRVIQASLPELKPVASRMGARLDRSS
jgi:hypothetical protein